MYNTRMKSLPASRRGFTLIELLVVIAVIGILASVVLASLNSARGKARDARRLSDMKQIQVALELYYDKYGQYPASDNEGCGGVDTPGDADFIGALTTEGFMPTNIKDPVADSNCGNYMYVRYNAGAYSCPINKAYYVLVIVDLETQGNPAATNPGWACPDRNWNTTNGEWVTGKYE